MNDWKPDIEAEAQHRRHVHAKWVELQRLKAIESPTVAQLHETTTLYMEFEELMTSPIALEIVRAGAASMSTDELRRMRMKCDDVTVASVRDTHQQIIEAELLAREGKA